MLRSLLLILCLSLTATAGELRRPLDVWCVGRCPNETAFWTDYQSDQAFRALIDQHYVVRGLVIGQHPVQALTKGIWIGPTFHSAGRPLIIGYRGPATLLNELGLRTSSPVPQSAPPPPPQPIDTDALRQSLHDSIRQSIEQSQSSLRSEQDDHLRRSQRQTLDQLQAIESRLQQQIADRDTATLDQLRNLAEQMARLQAPDFRLQTPDPPAGSARAPEATPTHPVTPPRHSPIRSLFALIAQLGPAVGLTVATGGGGLAIAWAVVSWFAKRRLQAAGSRSQGNSSPSGASAPARCAHCKRLESDKLQLANEIDRLARELAICQESGTNNFVPYERTVFKEAYDYAVREHVQRYPGAKDNLMALESLIKQYLGSQGVS